MRADGLLAAVLAVVLAQRLAELAYARRTARGLQARGARAVRPDGYAAIVAVHVCWFAAQAVESTVAAYASHRWLPLLALAAGGSALRYWCMAVLRGRWSTRVYVTGEPLVAAGPYRWLRHPIYVGVTVELVAIPLAFGLYASAAFALVANLAAVVNRVRIEDAALRRGA